MQYLRISELLSVAVRKESSKSFYMDIDDICEAAATTGGIPEVYKFEAAVEVVISGGGHVTSGLSSSYTICSRF